MRKSSLLLCLDYRYSNQKSLRYLSSTSDNLKSMKDLLVGDKSLYGLSEDDVVIMLDDERLNPTSTTVFNKLKDMILAMEDRDSLLFYFCGHGGRYGVEQWSNNTQHVEFICLPNEGDYITDFMLRELTKMVKPTCSFTMLAECCHSGGLIEGAVEQVGISTLPFYRPPTETQVIINDRIQSERPLGILFSACQSKEYAYSCARLGGSYFTNSIVKMLWKHSGNICNEPLAIDINDSLSGRQQIGLYCSRDQARHKFFEAPPPPPPPSPWTNKRPPLDVNAGSNQGGSDLTLKGRPFADSNSQVGRKQKQRLGSYSGLASSSGTANTVIPSSGSPSTPSMKTALATRQQNALGSLASRQNPLAVMDHLENDGSLGDNIGPLSSLVDTDHKGRVGKGFSFKEIKHGIASSHKVDCCHFSSDGKLLVTGGHDKKMIVPAHGKLVSTMAISDVTGLVASVSHDKSFKIWK